MVQFIKKEKLKALDLIDLLNDTVDFFPQTRRVLIICLAQSCTTATMERKFSILRRVKT